MNAKQITSNDVSLKSEFVISAEDAAFLSSLPPNLPETQLTKKQKDHVFNLYYKYISKNQVFKGWGTELYSLETKENWPSGPRVKQYEAQRMILGWLLNYSEVYRNISYKKAADMFYTSLAGREAHSILLSKIYDIR